MVESPRLTKLPPVSPATVVLRQKRRFAYCAVSCGVVDPRLTVKIVPPSAFSGFPPSAGGLNLGSRHVPVQVGGSSGSRTLLSSVSLYVTIVRLAVCEESRDCSQRTFQKSSLPVKLARLTPASRAACVAARISFDQYSSWPAVSRILWFWG